MVSFLAFLVENIADFVPLLNLEFGFQCQNSSNYKKEKYAFSRFRHFGLAGVFVYYWNDLPTLYSEVDLLRGRASFVGGDTLVPASLIGAHGGQLQRQVVQDVDLWTQAGVTASSQPGEIESNGADDVTAEDSSRARRGRHVPLN